MLAKVVLHSIKMEDGLQPADSKFKYLITSALPLEESLRDTDLIKVDFQMIAKVTITPRSANLFRNLLLIKESNQLQLYILTHCALCATVKRFLL